MTRARLGIMLSFALFYSCSRTGFSLPDSGTTDVTSDRVPGRNACGGTMALPFEPESACGQCGIIVCTGPDTIRCDERGMLNACGRCGPLPMEECNGRDDNCDGVTDEGCVLRVATLRARDQNARVSGNRVIFESWGRVTNQSDVVLVDVGTMQLDYLSPHAMPPDGPGDPSQDINPAIDGDWAAWIERRVDPLGPMGRLVAMNLTNRQAVTVSNRLATNPAIDRGRIVFEAVGGSNYEMDVWFWDAATGMARVLTDPSTDDREPDISGDWIVYTRGTGSSPLFNRQIIARNLVTSEELNVSEGLQGWNTQPAIDGLHIVWRREEGSQAPSRDGDIYLYDLGARVRRQLSMAPTGTNPRVSGERVCWSTVSSAPGGLIVADLASGRMGTLTPNGTHCDIDNTRVVFSESVGVGDVYLRDLLPGEP